MELKWRWACVLIGGRAVLIAPLWNWNRLRQSLPVPDPRSNRTFMELKLNKAVRVLRSFNVLIAPLWNWNHALLRLPAPAYLRSNRTFMELKFGREIWRLALSGVLIAPLWNWNVIFCSHYKVTLSVLIAPLWNWNQEKGAAFPLHQSSNRTFMELKLYSLIH